MGGMVEDPRTRIPRIGVDQGGITYPTSSSSSFVLLADLVGDEACAIAEHRGIDRAIQCSESPRAIECAPIERRQGAR